MSVLCTLRRWANRDDGRYYRAGNRKLGAAEAIGLPALPCSLSLWQLHSTVGLSSIWARRTGASGLVLALLGQRRNDHKKE